MMPHFWRLATTPILKIQKISFDYSWFLAKNLSNFVSLPWKLHNQYCHNRDGRAKNLSVMNTKISKLGTESTTLLKNLCLLPFIIWKILQLLLKVQNIPNTFQNLTHFDHTTSSFDLFSMRVQCTPLFESIVSPPPVIRPFKLHPIFSFEKMDALSTLKKG